ncbi:unnamed protein product [Rotaria socialis]|uniref:CDP-diacylglycerol--glycerol-3-phosphate 3-phosphatidyltransferase n=1 Tax=Rotaria socialis TaxID=392032 RepID=A0A818FKB9_9BILA|nr:unnamed protein product [Rotaria socialis]
MGMFNINYYQDFNIYFHSYLPFKSKLYLATPYFNVIKEYEQELIDYKRNDTTISFLTASPQANQFYGSRSVSAGYTGNEHNEELRTKFHQERIRPFQYGTSVISNTFKQLSRVVPF